MHESTFFNTQASVELWLNNVDRDEPRTRTWGERGGTAVSASVLWYVPLVDGPDDHVNDI